MSKIWVEWRDGSQYKGLHVPFSFSEEGKYRINLNKKDCPVPKQLPILEYIDFNNIPALALAWETMKPGTPVAGYSNSKKTWDIVGRVVMSYANYIIFMGEGDSFYENEFKKAVGE
jgi:hypothetical protein